MKFLISLALILFFIPSIGQAEDHTYQCRKEGNHVIHIVTLDPQHYKSAIVKAHNQVIGRETIEALAKRTGADIAINAGFFEIGNSEDGMPSGTLIINHQIFGLNLNKHACLLHDQKGFKIQEIEPQLVVKIGPLSISPKKVNKLCARDDVILYTHLWGERTFTPLRERQEIAISPNQKVVEVSKQGNIVIPQKGYVLSLPIHYPLQSISRGERARIHLDPFEFRKIEKHSAVMGIPILLQEGKLNPALAQTSSQSYKSPHARTALGLRSNGELVLVVAEHHYAKPIKSVTLEEVKTVISKNKLKIMAKYKKPLLENLTMTEMKEIVVEEYTSDSIVGLTLSELAALMKDLGCESAINLDGGGSSSLYMNNQVINRTVGDQDEGLGQTTLRPISSALIFKKAS